MIWGALRETRAGVKNARIARSSGDGWGCEGLFGGGVCERGERRILAMRPSAAAWSRNP